MSNETMAAAASEGVVSTPTQHTPGPWKYLDRGDDHTNHLITNEKGDAGIARPIARIHEIEKLYIEEMRANARLIAAAPELLHWCKELRGKLIDLASDDDSTPGVRRIAAILKGSGDAISKAQGDVR